jgi:hypothetical protein
MVFNGAQLHMLVNHVPVIGFMGIVLALAFAMKVQSADVKRFVLLGTVIVGFSGLAPYFTGEPAEGVVEHMATENRIHEHEELAEKATVLSVLTAVAAGFVLFQQRRRSGSLQNGMAVVLGLSVISAALMGAAAHEGGKIMHSEIRSPDEASRASGASESSESKSADKKD